MTEAPGDGTVLRAMAAGLAVALSVAGVAHGLPNEASYRIAAKLDVQRNLIVGSEWVSVTNRTGRPLDRLYFHLYPNAFRRGADSRYQQDLKEIAGIESVDAVYADPSDDAFMEIMDVETGGRPLRFRIRDTLLTVELEAPLGEGAQVELTIRFLYDLMEAPARGEMAASLGIRSGHRRDVYTVTLWYPKLAVYDRSGWNLEPYRFLGEFYGDFADYQVELEVPARFKVGATGRLESSTVLGGRKRLRFAAERVHDFAWAASPHYRVEERTGAGITVRGLYLDRVELVEQALDALRYFSEAFGPYAYPTFTVAQVEVGGGMEYPGIVMIGPGTVREVAHEVAHQWWYGAVGNDEFDEAWLDEGFATYSDERYRIEALGLPAEGVRSSWHFHEPGEVVLQPASAFSSLSAYVAAVYTKGSGILWMLRGLLGAETFDEVLRAYYQRFSSRNATTEDFVRVAEAVTGRELDWFFTQWLRTAETLDLFVKAVDSAPQQGGGFRHTVVIGRRGEAWMPVAVAVETEEGRTYELLWDGRGREARLPLVGGAPLRRVTLDPGRTLLEENRENNVWLRDEARLPGALPAGLAASLLLTALVARELVITRA